MMPQQTHSSHEELVKSRRPALRYARTVRGLVREDEMGVVLPHEHILLDLRSYHEPFYPDLAERPVALDMLGRLRRHPVTCLDNLVLDDVALATDELMAFARAGGGTLVDLTCQGPRLNLSALPQISEETGVNIVVGTGLFSPRFYPDSLAQETADSLADQFATDIEQEIDGTAVKAGVIGKLELENPGDERQEKVLRAGCRAAQRTSAPLALECPPGRPFDHVHRILQEEQVSPVQVLLCGMDRAMEQDERLRPAELGYYLLFDGFGKEWYVRGGEDRTLRDPERVRALKVLADAGFLRQLLISQGIDRKTLLVRYGGWGYAHIANNVIPMLVRERFAPKQITTLTIYNPARALAFISERE